jgi:hypothetical protein
MIYILLLCGNDFIARKTSIIVMPGFLLVFSEIEHVIDM